MSRTVESIFLNGTVGAGKSTVATAIGQILSQRALPHAIIDLDYIRNAWPAPLNDRFNHELELSNLTSMVENFVQANIETFILAGVIESSSEIPRYRKALGNRPLTICRITAQEDVLRKRLVTRHRNDPDDLAWHLDRTIELENILAQQALDDFVVDSSDRVAEEVAQEILEISLSRRDSSNPARNLSDTHEI
ncbi:AAA family ATPase [Brevibacterium picturae]|uniref:Adenylylsulfate kinase n=1 Tax=Brevibacterium picturae TaxID=260553 RepID=A0ABP4NKX3_9MICO